MEAIFTHLSFIINSASKSEYNFSKKCKNYFDYQPPAEIILNTTKERAYYIPLKQSLSSMLQNGQLLQAIIDNINSLSTRATKGNDLILSNRQSRSVKSNLSRQTNSNALLLKLYTDCIAITNLIGPKKDSHKFTCFYYLLDDLPDIIRSQVNSIGLHFIANNDGQIIQGVKNESWFKDLIGFHATESLPPDLMHDIAEDSSNKPPPVKKQQLTHSNIASSASQKLCLFRLFPLVFHDIIDDLTLLPLYTILREIISYIYSNPLRKSWLSYLDSLCKQFHSLMIEYLPDHAIPKVHFITEYPRSIEMHGLPILNSCIRFEAKHLYFKQIAIHEDIDGSTLVLLQHNDIAEIFPRIKDRVKFVNQLTKLTSSLSEQNENIDGTTTTANAFDLTSSSSFKPVDSIQENDTLDSSVLTEKHQSNNDIHQITDANLSSSINFPDDNDDVHAKAKLPSDYQGPDLTIRMQHCIDDNNISKFNPHIALHGELLSLLFDGGTKSHKLLYPTNDEYLTMAKCLVKKLHVPSALYHDAVPIISITDGQNENLLSIVDQRKLELLKDNPDLDMFHNLWQQSFNIRRLCIRDLTATEILERFPGYRLSEMISATHNTEVKECAGVNIEENVNDLLPKFFDHLPDNNCFLSDVSPIRVIRILCKFFGDPVGNIFTNEDVLVPYPCMKIHDDRFEIYLDFCLITETTSYSTALALLLSLYYVFEIRFGLHNRTCRLLYGILFEDSHYLNKALKNLLNSWQYEIVNRPLMKRQAMVTNLIENFTQPSIVNKNSSSSNNANEIVGESLEQIEEDQYSSSNLNFTGSTNIDQQFLNQHTDDDLNQLSNSDDEELNHLSIASPLSMSQCSSPVIYQSQTTSSFTIEDHSSNIYLEKTKRIYPPDKSSSKEQCEDEPDTYTEGKEPHSAAINRKRKQQTSSSSITTTAK
ncbi:unnamed protein product [Rotaria sp. Silwood2]|nr:unnamed protein product [Rotaria sp. Silwood2]CAF4230127.1 unnamed protein product [Rotaria sp. Silwood2]